MGASVFTLEQLGKLTAEFKARFGDEYKVALVHEPERGYKMEYPQGGDEVYAVINAVEPAIAEAVFMYGRAIAAHAYALVHPGITLKCDARVRSEFASIVGKAHASGDGGEILNFLCSLAPHAWAMARHDGAADYTRFEMVKFMSLRKSVAGSPRAMQILARAHVRVAADAYGVDVDPSKITAGIRLNVDDLAVLKTAKKLLRGVRRQGMRGANIDMTDGIGEFAEAVRAQLEP